MGAGVSRERTPLFSKPRVCQVLYGFQTLRVPGLGEVELMPGPPPKPTEQRRRRNAPARGDWHSASAVGWRYGSRPKPPTGLMPASRTAGTSWFKSWFAAPWTPDDLPGLRVVILLYDQVERGEFQRSSEMRLWMSDYGITPGGAQARRWKPPESETSAESIPDYFGPRKPDHYKRLRVVE